MSIVVSFIVIYDILGIYDVILVVINVVGSVIIIEEGFIMVGDVLFVFIDLEMELGSLMISVSGLDSLNIDEWQWDFGDGNEVIGVDVMYIYVVLGMYIIMFIIINECGIVIVIIEVIVFIVLVGIFMVSMLNICLGEIILFVVDEIEGVIYSWDILGGDFLSSIDVFVGVIFVVVGIYEVSLSVMNVVGIIIISQIVVVNELLVVDFFFIINGFIVSFMNISLNVISFVWIFFGNDSMEENLEYIFFDVGIYEVILLVGNDCGEDLWILIVEIVGEILSVNFMVENNEGCSGLMVFFFSMIEGVDEIMWNFFGGILVIFIDFNLMVSYENLGVYMVILMVSNVFGINVIIQEVIVMIYEEVLVSVSFDLVEIIVMFSVDVIVVISFIWIFFDGFILMMEEFSYIFFGNGMYIVLYIYSGFCGQGEISIEVVIDGVLLVIDVQIDVNMGCGLFIVSFMDVLENNLISWLWSFFGGDLEILDE